MAVRIRQDGTIVCAAMHPEQPGDTYLDDGLHYRLCELRALVTDCFHLFADPDAPRVIDPEILGGLRPEQLDGHGLWWWANEVPEGVVIES